MTDKSQLPLVYSCSGCSTAAQMANHFAVELDHRGLAEMVRKIKGQEFDLAEANAALETVILPTIPKTTSQAR